MTVEQIYLTVSNIAPMTFGPFKTNAEVSGCKIYDAGREYNCMFPTARKLQPGESVVFDAGAVTAFLDRDETVVRCIVDESKMRIVKRAIYRMLDQS